jgi:DMSO/TMAO reductase YedYZ molybdopterin-dependent catalytic subunit
VRRVRTFAALAGIAAAGVALGVAEAVAVLTGPRSTPLVAVGGVVVDSVPEPVKEFGISLFGTHDKLALLIGTGVLLALFAAAVGLLARRRLAYGIAGVALFGLVGTAAALTRHGAGWWYALPSVIGAAAGAGVLTVLTGRLPASEEDARTADGRRQFLRYAGGVLAGAVVAGLGGHWLANRRGVSAARAAVRLPVAASPAAGVPAGADFGIPQMTPFLTSPRDFYRIDTALVAPQVDPTSWSLRVHGRVDKPLTLTYQQLLARPMIERYVTLACVSNEVGGNLVGNGRWLGVPLKDLLDEVGVHADADQVVSRSVDGFTAGTPTAALRDGRDAILAVGLDGAPLPVEHGFPVRMVVPGLYGYVSATKWLAELELSRFGDFDAYWIKRGWAQQAPIKTESRIDTPTGDVRAGQVTVAGVAWAQHRGVSKVEVRVDNGPWQQATLAAVPSIDTWRQWKWTWTAAPGRHRLQVRATDNGGQAQTEDHADPFPDGATGWHTVDVTVR